MRIPLIDRVRKKNPKLAAEIEKAVEPVVPVPAVSAEKLTPEELIKRAKVPDLPEMKRLYLAGEHKKLARFLPYFQEDKNPFIRFLFEGNLIKMGKLLEEKSFTIGADPEFILIDAEKMAMGEEAVVLFSSKHNENSYLQMSEVAIGADYGLLEFRTDIERSVSGLIKNLDKIQHIFETAHPKLLILGKEAIQFNHKLKRIRESLENKDKKIDYGARYVKGNNVASKYGSDQIIFGDSIDGFSFSAYNVARFPKYNEELFTAGGHIHIGGTFVTMLSFPQIQELVRKFDEFVLPICEKVETPAATLRRTVYGDPGEFRIKPYGIEYRSPSNAIFWKKNRKMLARAVGLIIRLTKTFALKRGKIL